MKVWSPFTKESLDIEPTTVEKVTTLLMEKNEEKFDSITMEEKRKMHLKEFNLFGGYDKLLDSRKDFKY